MTMVKDSIKDLQKQSTHIHDEFNRIAKVIYEDNKASIKKGECELSSLINNDDMQDLLKAYRSVYGGHGYLYTSYSPENGFFGYNSWY